MVLENHFLTDEVFLSVNEKVRKCDIRCKSAVFGINHYRRMLVCTIFKTLSC